MRLVLLVVSICLATSVNAQTRSPRSPQQTAPPRQSSAAIPIGPFTNAGKVLENALSQAESLKDVSDASVFVNATETAKNFISVKELSDIASASLYTGKFRANTSATNDMPILGFSVAVSDSPGFGGEVAKALLIRVVFVQAIPQRGVESGGKFFAVTTYDDVYFGYGRTASVIHEKLSEGMKEMAQNFAKAYASVH